VTAHFPLDRLRSALVADGVNVIVVAGAQGRSARRFTNGYYRGCQASVVHHTASSGRNPAAEVNYILRGKGDGHVIANVYTALDGAVHLIASGPTYTEGSGGPYGIIPANRANDVAFSNEVAGGMGAPFPTPEQTRSVALVHGHANRIAADVWGWPDDPFAAHRLFAHFDWAPGRKIDPAGESPWSTGYTRWNMNGFRADARAATEPNQGDTDMDPFRWRPHGYSNQFLIGAGPALHITPAMAAHVKADTVLVNEPAPHAQGLKSVMHQAGVTDDDLVPYP